MRREKKINEKRKEGRRGGQREGERERERGGGGESEREKLRERDSDRDSDRDTETHRKRLEHTLFRFRDGTFGLDAVCRFQRFCETEVTASVLTKTSTHWRLKYECI